MTGDGIKRINLLPPSRRLDLRRRVLLGSARALLGTGLAGLLMLNGVGLVLLTGVWVVIWTTPSPTEIQIADQLARYGNLVEKINRRNQGLKLLIEIGAHQPAWSQKITIILGALPAETKLKELKTDWDEQVINLKGIAANRSSLVSLERDLNQLAWVKTIKSPVTNLIERERIPFEMLINLNKLTD
jgi:Tfp pilus assembly protein PilN